VVIAVFTHRLQRAGAITLALGSAGFVAVFFYLQATFGYPDILDRDASVVLPALAAGGSTLRAVWLVYAALPLTLIVAGIASMPLLEAGGGRGLARLGAAAAALASLAMMIGLARWPSIQWSLAQRWDAVDQREMLAAIFEVSNRYLGNLFGELLGELALAGWFACIGVALRLAERRTLGTLSLGAAVIVAAGAFRIEPVATLSSFVLPLWLFATAAILWISGCSRACRPTR
jgi:hypothetical protein